MVTQEQCVSVHYQWLSTEMNVAVGYIAKEQQEYPVTSGWVYYISSLSQKWGKLPL